MSESFWASVIGWAVLIFGGGTAWGYQRFQIRHHQKIIDGCKMEKLMTEDKCKEFHKVHQETTNVTLKNIEDKLDAMVEMNTRSDERAGAMSSSIAVMFDRWEQKYG